MTRYIQKNSNDITELDGEYIILNTEELTITKINEVGGFCLSLLRESQTADSITQTLVDRYKLEGHEINVKKDVLEFISSLHEFGLIEKC